MRKVYFSFILLMCSCAVMAQKGSYFSGIKAGVNFYNTDAKLASGVSQDVKPGINAGIFFHFPVVSFFSIHPELLYSGQRQEFTGNNSKTSNKTQYFTVPVMFQGNFSGFHIETGPVFGVLVKGTSTVTNNGTESKLDLKKQVKAAAFWWGAGLGYRMKNIGLGGRYNFGISDVSKSKSTDEKSSGFEVSLSWWFKQDK